LEAKVPNAWELKPTVRETDATLRGKTEPNKAKCVKAHIMSEMSKKFRKQSQMTYRLCFQRIAAILMPFFEKNKCARAIPAKVQKQSQTKPNRLKAVL
jgi:hypothetical protein